MNKHTRILHYNRITHKRYKYELTQREVLQLPTEGYATVLRTLLAVKAVKSKNIHLTRERIVLDVGFRWDGTSGPTWDTETSMIGSAVHDALYKLMRQGLVDRVYQEFADKWFLDLNVAAGMYVWRAKLFYYAVRAVGYRSTRLNEQANNS